MEQWKNRIAVVTGASAGIGAAIAKDLVKAGMIVIGLARRVDLVEALKNDLPEDLRKNLHSVQCDLTNEADIILVFSWIVEKYNGIDILINNAGIGPGNTELIASDNSEAIRKILDTNVLGLIFCTREAYKSMEKHGRNSHVVHINSVSGHKVFCNLAAPSRNMYSPSKFAVTAITEIHRQEFIRSKHHIKVTSISPGLVKTELPGKDMLEKHSAVLEPEDVSQSVLYVLGTPPHVQVHELTIKPFGEVF
ncbi:farnesol dehydrogenase-like [Sergentomyia squamirostris]